MEQKHEKKQVYEAPKAEVVEFELTDHIAASTNTSTGQTETFFD